MKYLFALIALVFSTLAIGQVAGTANCPVTMNGITLNPTVNPVSSRLSAITPFQVAADATNTTTTNPLGGMANTFQDVYYAWNWDDADVSGTSTWQNGANPGKNLMGVSTGPVADHLYINTGTTDVVHHPQVWAYDGTGYATCRLPAITVFAMFGANGYTGTNVTCVSSSGTPVAGSGGCPVGAAVLNTGSLATATGATPWASNKAVMLKCGDTFTGNGALRNVSHARFGAYGGCQNTTTNRPMFTGGSTFSIHSSGTDVAVSDLDFETSGNTAGASMQIGTNAYPPILVNAVVYNVRSVGYNSNFWAGSCSECSIVNDYAGNMGTVQGSYLNLMEQRCVNGSVAYNCGLASPLPNFTNCVVGAGTQFYQGAYLYVAGSFFSGAGASNSGGIETVRAGGGSCYVWSNNTFENANTTGATLKRHCGVGPNNQVVTIGNPCYYEVNSDNLYQGQSGAQLMEQAPENSQYDERAYYTLIERNLFIPSTHVSTASLLLDNMNATVRDNVFDGSLHSTNGIQACRRGVAGNGGGGAPAVSTWPSNNEIYNNTGIADGISLNSGNACTDQALSLSIVQNNLFWTGSVVSNGGTGNTVTNNTTSSATNPSFAGGTAPFANITGYAPTNSAATANSLPGVPNFFDGCTNGGFMWLGGMQLGALSPACP